MSHVTWSVEALRDLRRLRDFIAETRPGSARRAGTTIRGAVQLLSSHPESGRLRSPLVPDVRQWTIVFGRSAYLVLYRYSGRDITVMAIQHGREDRRSDETP